MAKKGGKDKVNQELEELKAIRKLLTAQCIALGLGPEDLRKILGYKRGSSITNKFKVGEIQNASYLQRLNEGRKKEGKKK